MIPSSLHELFAQKGLFVDFQINNFSFDSRNKLSNGEVTIYPHTETIWVTDVTQANEESMTYKTKNVNIRTTPQTTPANGTTMHVV
uniref:hypothetical protein n=1 Tax=Crenothrix polyspora TaxID=360316 RepID=UPI001C4EADA7